MEAVHYSIEELEQMGKPVAAFVRHRDHLKVCEQCSLLLALVQRARGAPSDEEAEVTLDALKRCLASSGTGHVSP